MRIPKRELKSCFWKGNARQPTLQPIPPLSSHWFHTAGLLLSMRLHRESLALRLSICSLSRCLRVPIVCISAAEIKLSAQKDSKKQVATRQGLNNWMEYSSSLSAATVKQLELQTIVGLAAAACISHILAYVMLALFNFPLGSFTFGISSENCSSNNPQALKCCTNSCRIVN